MVPCIQGWPVVGGGGHLPGMGWRFRRRIRILPGIRLNLSKTGPGLSLGGRGGSVSVGPSGPHMHAGLPGTGLHYRKKVRLPGQGNRRGGPAGSRVAAGDPGAASASPPRTAGGAGGGPEADSGGVLLRIQAEDSGHLTFLWEDGTPLSETELAEVRRADEAGIRETMAELCRHWNRDMDQVLALHLETPAPDPPLALRARPFPEPPPAEPVLPEGPGVLGRLVEGVLSGRREAREEAAARVRDSARREREAWEEARQAHEALESERLGAMEAARAGDEEAVAEALEHHFADVPWPRETEVGLEVEPGGDGGIRLWLDVDLAPRDAFPREEARPAKRELRILVRERSDRQRREEYRDHVHGFCFRAVGEAFHALPGVEEVVVTGFTQAVDPATGADADEVLLSARIERAAWGQIRFDRLEEVHLPRAFQRFPLRRDMTKTGIFRPVEPFVP
ncbi:MAG: DUF4236 domain-containing protein [Gemmatimonadales bacterium]|nr:MAG: DUF4236 domain-containing protein [Gemmatimonadales bacterium]